MASFKVAAAASEYLAITGWGIDGVKLAKEAWVWPGQRCHKFDTTPVTYDEFEVHAMTAEELPFALPVVLTIGPKISSEDGDDSYHHASLLLYTKLFIAPRDETSSDVRELVKGVVEGQVRVLAASMTMEEIFRGAESFEQAVLENAQVELDQLGLYVYDANVKLQLVGVDVPGGQGYSSYRDDKTEKVIAVNQAKVDVAEARTRSAVVGGKELEETTLRQKAAEVAAASKASTTLGFLGVASASTAMAMAVREPPPGLDENAYFLALSGAFFTGVAGVIFAVWVGDDPRSRRGAGRKLVYASIPPLAVVVAAFSVASLLW